MLTFLMSIIKFDRFEGCLKYLIRLYSTAEVGVHGSSTCRRATLRMDVDIQGGGPPGRDRRLIPLSPPLPLGRPKPLVKEGSRQGP